jgi:hypothetical protein
MDLTSINNINNINNTINYSFICEKCKAQSPQQQICKHMTLFETHNEVIFPISKSSQSKDNLLE